jgi:hypothetical protein
LFKWQATNMIITEKILAYVQRLPAPLQSEVLDFIEYLLAKAERDIPHRESEAWSGLSLTSAMRGMETEETPSYTVIKPRLSQWLEKAPDEASSEIGG